MKKLYFFNCTILHKKSFSLVELSIVLLVISLLTATVLTGTTIIRNANATKIMNEINTYRQAINSFYRIHEALPGDFSNVQYELAPSGYSTTAITNIASLNQNIRDKIPINGDQNGAVSYNISGNATYYYSEAFGVWSHLSANNLIDKIYSNSCYNIKSNTRTNCLKAGYNLPLISNGHNNNSVYIFYKPDFTASIFNNLFGTIKDQNYVQNSHFLTLTDISRQYIYSNKTSIGNIVVSGGGGIASDIMLQIDSKMDDGFPLTGLVFGINGANEDGEVNSTLKDGQCNTYLGSNSSFTGTNIKNISYTNKSNKSCLGVVLFTEFSN